MPDNNIALLIIKFWRNELNDQEKMQLDNWLASSPENSAFMERLMIKYYVRSEHLPFARTSTDSEFDALIKKYRKQAYRRTQRVRAVYYLAAASFFSIVVFISYPLSNPRSVTTQSHKMESEAKRVIIQLADGALISPDKETSEYLVNQGNYRLHVHDTALTYSIAKDAGAREQPAINYIIVPPGRQYKVILPDSSKVWLNAASTMRIPVSTFASKRIIEITGEAFFEVKKEYLHDIKTPFIVDVNTPAGLKQKVFVTGTAFNINAYCDELLIKTTLVEGQVFISSEGKTSALLPGQEFQLGKRNERKFKTAALESVTAWRNDSFVFTAAPIQYVLNEVRRWYGKQVVFKGDSTLQVFWKGPRSLNIDEVLGGILYTANCVVEKDGDRRRLVKPKQ